MSQSALQGQYAGPRERRGEESGSVAAERRKESGVYVVVNRAGIKIKGEFVKHVMSPEGGWRDLARPLTVFAGVAERIRNVLSTSPRTLEQPLRPKWPRPCEEMFEYLARHAPFELAPHLVDPQYSAGLRARAARAGRFIPSTTVALRLLLPLLDQQPPIVREGAIYGLVPHRTAEVVKRLREIATDQTTTDGVRATALEVLEDDE